MKELSELIKDTVKLKVNFISLPKNQMGTMYKVLDVSKIHILLGWSHNVELEEGIQKAYE
ncbi:hypothetical protein [Nitratiruptor tergarcus]|uniref:hypothetical protein n=1 Tax=Nitratiruptor tergarcus TaxID=269259 RepID=UPI000A051F03|nr:hypothetical protein [Nitratiruptor tergarcus]